jgi:ssDNA-binding Zn-finger/Zn-ribbon topoisomerase 1
MAENNALKKVLTKDEFDLVSKLKRQPGDEGSATSLMIDIIVRLSKTIEQLKLTINHLQEAIPATARIGEAYHRERDEALAEIENLKRDIECPRCGEAAGHGRVTDGDALACGCKGIISCDTETEPYVTAEVPCLRCKPEPSEDPAFIMREAAALSVGNNCPGESNHPGCVWCLLADSIRKLPLSTKTGKEKR